MVKYGLDLQLEIWANLNFFFFFFFFLGFAQKDTVVKEAQIKASLFVCTEVLRPSQPNGVMLSAVSLPNHTFTGQA